MRYQFTCYRLWNFIYLSNGCYEISLNTRKYIIIKRYPTSKVETKTECLGFHILMTINLF